MIEIPVWVLVALIICAAVAAMTATAAVILIIASYRLARARRSEVAS